MNDFKLVVKGCENPTKWDNNYFKNRLAKERRLYDKDVKSGKKDPGYVWAFLKLSLFIECVFTMKAVPNELTLEIPAGQVHLTVPDKERWIVRNDFNNSVAVYEVESLFDWAIKVYPDGIGSEGYEQLTMHILAQGCDEKTTSEIYDKTFFEEAA